MRGAAYGDDPGSRHIACKIDASCSSYGRVRKEAPEAARRRGKLFGG